MKKSILASSIAAAMFGLGAVGAHAQAITVTEGGQGDMLIVPYFSTQSDNATLLNLTNTDLKSGKAVKVRFRGAANSDDVFDFQVFLSPGDVWTATVTKGADGLSRLSTSDKSCTKPSAAVLNATPFITSRLDQRLTGDALAAGTREGYIEIIGMADIPKDSTTAANKATAWVPTNLTTAPQTDGLLRTVFPSVTAADAINPLWTAIKHVDGVAPCSGTAFTALDSTDAFNLTNTAAAKSWVAAGTQGGPAAQYGMTPLTGGLMADWAIVNVVNAAAWGGQATALSVTTTDRLDPLLGNMNVVYAPQIGVGTGLAIAKAWSADPLFLQADNNTLVYNMSSQNYVAPAGVAPVFAAGYYDLPDLSTAFVNATPGTKLQSDNATQIQAITDKLAGRAGIIGDYATESSINGATDWVFSMPTRRYSVAMAYSKITGTNDGRVWNRHLNNHVVPTAALVDVDGTSNGFSAIVSNQFRLSNTSIVGNLICVNGARPVAYDREERTKTTAAEVVVSPSTVAGGVKLCGEASVLAFNNGTASAAVKGAVAVTGVDVGFNSGWATMNVSAGIDSSSATVARNYPIAGGVFQRAAFGAQGFGIYRPFR